jgi:hypothetical protein
MCLTLYISTHDTNDGYSNDPQVKLAMPFTLKKALVDDWEKVTR